MQCPVTKCRKAAPVQPYEKDSLVCSVKDRACIYPKKARKPAAVRALVRKQSKSAGVWPLRRPVMHREPDRLRADVRRAEQGLPYSGSAGTVFLYGVILATMGLTISWAAPACNNPVFAEVCSSPSLLVSCGLLLSQAHHQGSESSSTSASRRPSAVQARRC